jgi:CRP-like cAMP-binding protein
LAFLTDGAYFGEIGILLRDKRTVSVRARGIVYLSAISKQDFLPILDSFPEYLTFLRKVGIQRLETTDPESVDMDDEIYCHSTDSEEEEENEPDEVECSVNM